MVSRTIFQTLQLLLSATAIVSLTLFFPRLVEAGGCTMNFAMKNDSNKPVTILKVQISASKAITYGAWGPWKKVDLKGIKTLSPGQEAKFYHKSPLGCLGADRRVRYEIKQGNCVKLVEEKQRNNKGKLKPKRYNGKHLIDLGDISKPCK